MTGVISSIASAVVFLPLFFEAYQIARGSDGCHYRSFDVPWDETWALEGVHGEFSWWPTGLTCIFPIRTGEEYVVPPDPAQSVQLVVAIALAVVAVGALAVAVVLQLRKR
jgi:hypothetical protein